MECAEGAFFRREERMPEKMGEGEKRSPVSIPPTLFSDFRGLPLKPKTDLSPSRGEVKTHVNAENFPSLPHTPLRYGDRLTQLALSMDKV